MFRFRADINYQSTLTELCLFANDTSQVHFLSDWY